MEDTFDVVFVCTGNRFRSPIAAAVFAAATAGQPVRTRSLGTLNVSGAPALPEAQRVCSLYGLDLSRHRSRRLGDLPLEDSDLVVGFEPKHVARAVVDGSARRQRSFLLTELVETLDECELLKAGNAVSCARAAVWMAHERRADGHAMPIPDPFGGSPSEYEHTAALVHDLTTRLAGLLFARE